MSPDDAGLSAPTDETWVEGRVTSVLWAASDGGYAVLKVQMGEERTVVVGPLGLLAQRVNDDGPGLFVSFEGRWVTHPVHGRQFKAEGFLLGAPRTREGLVRYLGSAGVHGVGDVIAKRIVRAFGDETAHVLSHDPGRLQEVDGVGAGRAQAIADAWAADAGSRALTILLRGAGVTPGRVRAIVDTYGDDAHDVIRRDPYRLAAEVRGFGFVLTDRLARALGVAPDDPSRVQAAVAHVVKRAGNEGHTLVPRADVVAQVARLGVPTEGLPDAVDELTAQGRLVSTDDEEGAPSLALASLYEAEARVAAHVVERSRSTPADAEAVEAEVRRAEALEGITLDPSQRDAVIRALGGGLVVVTGGPGTGKTTLVRVLLRAARERGALWSLASPTGRAARRLADSTGQEASTLHRLLEVDPSRGGFQRDATNPLETDGLVVDEVSMVDTRLMAALLDALPLDRPCPLVLVGDADQLPSVGPGQVLRDLVRSGLVPVARLSTVHRQASESGILVGARAILEGRAPVSGQVSGHDDFFWIHRDDPEGVLQGLLEVVTNRLPGKGFDPRRDIQVLSPTRKGPLGTRRLNEALQQALNPRDDGIRVGSRRYAPGDRVLCIRNRYDHGVFNGDVGQVEHARKDGLDVRFDGEVISWARADLDDLDLAYAITVHKSQGSEYPATVLLLHRAHGIMLRRNLLYTAVTRARDFFCGLGDRRGLSLAVSRAGADRRRTALVPRLREQWPDDRQTR